MTLTAKLKDYTSDSPRKKKVFTTVEPIFVRKLSKVLDTQGDVAQKLGVTSSNISAILRSNKAHKTTELAARYVYEKEFAGVQPAQNRVAVIQAPAHVIKTIKDILDSVGGRISVIPENKE